MLDPATDSPRTPDSTIPADAAASQESPIADCCEVSSRIARHFNDRIAELTEDGELPEMVDVSGMLLRLLGEDAAAGHPSLLELGCGSGALLVELVSRGAARGDGIDLSPDMVAAARQRANAAEIGDRVSITLGDAALVPLERHDWVVMDRVICCYPHVEKLLANATRAAAQRIAFTVPTSRGWRGVINRIGWRAENIPLYLGRRGCQGFVHDLGRIELILANAGFAKHSEDRLGLWYAAVWDNVA